MTEIDEVRFGTLMATQENIVMKLHRARNIHDIFPCAIMKIYKTKQAPVYKGGAMNPLHAAPTIWHVIRDDSKTRL